MIFWIVLLYAYAGQSQSEDKSLQADKILKLLPNKIEEFYSSADPQGKVIRLGNIHYSVAEKNFRASRRRFIKILLFDYKEAPIMYSQATHTWSSFTKVETDSLVLRPTSIKDCAGWESYNAHENNSRIMLGICDRFFLTVQGTGVELEFLKKVVQEFKFETYPR